MLHCNVTWYNILWPKQNVYLVPWREQLKDTIIILEGYHQAISPQPFMSFKQTPHLLSPFSNEPSDLCQVKSSMGKHMNRNLSSWLFPLRSMNWYSLVFDYESPESATLLLTDCSLSTAIKAFVFHTIPQSHLLRRDDGGPFENNEAAWFIILIRRSETLAKPQLY